MSVFDIIPVYYICKTVFNHPSYFNFKIGSRPVFGKFLVWTLVGILAILRLFVAFLSF
jgi:hypothetical protein